MNLRLHPCTRIDRRGMEELCGCGADPSRTGMSLVLQRSNAQKMVARWRWLAWRLQKICQYTVPSYANRLRHLQGGNESLPIDWCYLVNPQPRSNQDQCWQKFFSIWPCHFHKAIFVDVVAVTRRVHPKWEIVGVGQCSGSAVSPAIVRLAEE